MAKNELRVHVSLTLPLRFYFPSEQARDEITAEIAEFGADRHGPFIQINGAYGKILWKEIVDAGGMKVIMGKRRIILTLEPHATDQS